MQLHNIWSCLESSRGLTAVAASWRERLGDQFDSFKTAFLQRASGVPKGIPCPRGCACTHEILSDECRVSSDGRAIGRKATIEANSGVRELDAQRESENEPPPSHSRITHHASRSSPATLDTPHSAFRAICRCDPPNCPDIPLTPEDIVLFELSWLKISRALSLVFQLDYKPADLGLLNTRQIGSWSVDAVPVILTIQHERAWFRTVLLELIARLRRRFILLAPTTKNLDAVSQELLASSDAGFFSLDANLMLTDHGTLLLTGARAPGELFAKFTPQPRDAEASLATRAFALVQQLDAQGTRRRPTALTVFRMYCIDGLNASTIARKTRCSRMTVRQRLKLIEAKTNLKINQLRKVSAHLERAEASFSDSRASHIHRKNLIYDDDDSSES